MKIKISVNDHSVKGYLNIDPYPLDPIPAFTGNLAKLDMVVQGECKEILADKIMDYVAAQDVLVNLKHWISLLGRGGKIILGGTDLISVSKGVYTQRLNLVDANKLIFGERVRKNGQNSLCDLVDILTELGLRITKKKIEDYQFVVEAVRD